MRTSPFDSRTAVRSRSGPDQNSRTRSVTWTSTSSPRRCLPTLTCCQVTHTMPLLATLRVTQSSPYRRWLSASRSRRELPTCWPPSSYAHLSRTRTTTEPLPPSRAFSRRRTYPTCADGSWAGGNDVKWFPCSLEIDQSAGHPALLRQHRHNYAAGFRRGLPTGTLNQLRNQPPTQDGRALHPDSYTPDLNRCHPYGALLLVPVVYRLISLAGPNLSGSSRPPRLCQRCFPPSPASPGSGCAQLPLGCCDNPARRSHTSFDS
ncbi:hypothetical protein SAMN06265360_13413 [Haloechinothrix alba]|uniref:Uncharacterized protein n=1 Tax=Haloechinothrix alba TaxID=664784 RepID=A0A239A9U5_9PSEU|nr:hypothetical protein SAMN06265360_13413 [Haloechinothrix alba]